MKNAEEIVLAGGQQAKGAAHRVVFELNDLKTTYKCKICNVGLKYNKSTTANLKNHLVGLHKEFATKLNEI